MKNLDQFSNESAYRKLCEARARLWVRSKFFGSLASRLQIVERADCETMATDGIHLFFAPDFVLAEPMEKLVGTVAHEAEHCARGHIGRIGNRDLEQSNIAADLAINADLTRLGFSLPDGALLDWQFAGMTFEEIYAARAQAQRQNSPDQAQPQQDAGETGETGESGQSGGDAGDDSGDNDASDDAGSDSSDSGNNTASDSGDDAGDDAGGNSGQSGNAGESGDAGDAGEMQGGDDAGEKSSSKAHGGTFGGIVKPENASASDIAELADKWQVWTRQAAAMAVKEGGNIAGYARGLLDELNASPVDVRAELRQYIDSRVATDCTFARPNRRFLAAGDILPGTVIDGLSHLVFIIDSSGSIDETMLKNAAGAIVESLESGAIERLTILWADTHVRHVQEFETGDSVNAETLRYHGGGGTRFDNALAWVAENASDATAIVYLTDLEVFSQEAWGIEPDCPLLWAVHGTRRGYDGRAAGVPFGETVHIGMLD